MKRSKKLLSLVMAMLMAFSLMAVTAAAYGESHEHDCAVCSEETVMPRMPGAWCHSCGTAMVNDGVVWENGNRYVVFHCATCTNTAKLPW